jgi:ParB family chromosome partitioning protein
VGKDRTTVTNLLRVLSLPSEIQANVEAGELSLGHARALLPLTDLVVLVDLASSAIAQKLSVRELEQLVRERTTPKEQSPYAPTTQPATQNAASRPASPAAKRVEDDLRRYLQTDVRLRLSGEHKGSIEIAFYSNDDLDRVLDLVLREHRKDF